MNLTLLHTSHTSLSCSSCLSDRSPKPSLKPLSLVCLPQGNVTFQCSLPQRGACTFLSSTSSFLSLPSPLATTPMGGFSVRFQFRTWNVDGLLLSVPLNPDPQRLDLRLSDSRLHLTLQTSTRQKSEVFTGQYTLQLHRQ